MNKPAPLLLLSCLLFALPVRAAEAPATPAPAAPTPVTVVDLKDADAPTRLMLACLQGIVNREGPKLYCVTNDRDFIWFNDVYAHHGYKAVIKMPEDAVAQFAGQIKGQVIYDPAQPETINLATALAGVEDALPVPKPEDGRKTVEDLRGKFQGRADACKWAVEKLLPRCTPRALAVLAPDQIGLRDYLVAYKILPVGLDPKVPEEAALLRSLIDRLPDAAPVLWGGHVGDPEASRALLAKDAAPSVPAMVAAQGKLLIPGADCANFSFHSRVPAYMPLRQVKRLVQHSPKTTYVTFVYSGNGNLDFALGRMRELWEDPDSGMVPMGWEMHPALLEMAPAVMASYYADARWTGTDQFLMAPSGATWLAPADEKAFGTLLAGTERAARDADLGSVLTLGKDPSGGDKPWDPLFREPDIHSVVALGTTTMGTRASGRPVIGEIVYATDVEKAAKAIVEAATKHFFILVVLDPAAITPTQAAQIAGRLNRDYTIVRPYDFMDLLAERDALDHFDIHPPPPARLTRVNYSPAKPGPMDPITVVASVSGPATDVRVVYSVNSSPDLTEPMELVNGEYRATIPPTLRSASVQFKVRMADLVLRTFWSQPCTVRVEAPDTDKDGLSDIEEAIYGTDPNKPDTDGDGLTDANDPAPLVPFPKAKGLEGPVILNAVTVPRVPPAGGKAGAIQALVFDPAGVKSVSVALESDGRELPGGEMKEVEHTQVYARAVPALNAGKTLQATITATNDAGKSSQLKLAFPVGVGVRITHPSDGYRAQKPVVVDFETNGQAAMLRVLVNGYQVAKLAGPPYRYVFDTRDYVAGNHEVVVEAYDAKGQLLDADLIHIKMLPRGR